MSAIFKSKKISPEEKKISPEQITTQNKSIFKTKVPTKNEIFGKEERFSPYENEDFLQREIERSQARTTSRVGETILGFPGDVQNFIKSFLPESLQGLAGIQLPTSENLQQLSEKASLGYTSPKSDIEKDADEFSKDVGGMMIPGGPGYSFARNIGIPLAGLAVKKGLDGNDFAKYGTMFLLDLISSKRAQIPTGNRGLGGAQRYINSLFQQAERSLPQGQHLVDVNPMIAALQNQRALLQRGGSSPSKTAALTKIDELLARTQNGQMDIHEFMPARRAINEIIESMGGWNFELPPAIRQRSIDNLQRVKRSVIDAGENYGRQHNPEFFQYWRDANQAGAVASRSNVVGNFIQKTLGKYALHPIAKSLFGLSSGIGAFFKPAAGAVAATGFGGYQAIKALIRAIQSPVLRTFYERAIRSATTGQKESLIRNAQKLNKEIKKEESEKEKKKKKIFED